MSDYCIQFDDAMNNAVRALVKTWRLPHIGRRKAEIGVQSIKDDNGVTLDRMSEDEQEKHLVAYFKEAIIRSHNGAELSAKDIMNITLNEIDKKLADLYEAKWREDMENQGKRNEIPIIVGGSYTDDLKITEPLNGKIKITREDKKKLIALVDRRLKRRLGSAYNNDNVKQILSIISSASFTGKVSDMYKAITLASLTNSKGEVRITKEALKKVLNGDEHAGTEISKTYADQKLDKGDFSTADTGIMKVLVNRYLQKNLDALDFLTKNGERQIKTRPVGASRTERVYKSVINSIKDSLSGETVDLNEETQNAGKRLINRKLEFTGSEDMFRELEDKVNAYWNSVNKDPEKKDYFKGLGDWLVEAVGDSSIYNPKRLALLINNLIGSELDGVWTHSHIHLVRDDSGKIIGLGGTIDGYTEYGDIKDVLGSSSNKLYEEPTSTSVEFMSDVLSLLYEEATSGYNILSSDVAKFYRDLSKYRGKQFTGNGVAKGMVSTEALFDAAAPVLMDIRDKALVENEQEEDEASEQEYIAAGSIESKFDKIARNTTTTAAQVRFNSRELKERTEAIVHGMLNWASFERWKEISSIAQHIEALQNRIDGYKAEIARYRETMQQIKNGESNESPNVILNLIEDADDKIKEEGAKIQEAQDSIDRLRDDVLYVREMFKRRLSDAKKAGMEWASRDKYKGQGTSHHDAEWFVEQSEAVKRLEPELCVRAFDLLYTITGIKIRFNRAVLTYEVVEEGAEANEEPIKIDEDDTGKVMKAEDMNFSDEVDPWKHLNQIIRQEFSMIPKLSLERDKFGRRIPITDELGNPTYWDAKDILLKMLSLVEDEIVDPEDMCRRRAEAPNAVDKTEPGLFKNRIRSAEDGHGRTEAEAFPNGVPEFPVLERYIDRYPWMEQVIERLKDGYRRYRVAGKEKTEYGKLTGELYSFIGFTHLERMIADKGHMVITNSPNDEANVKLLQKHNYNARTILHEKMLWDYDGNVNAANADDIRKTGKALSNAISNGQLKGMTREKKTEIGRSIEELLRRVGIEVPTDAIVQDIVNHPTKKKLGQIAKIADLVGWIADAGLYAMGKNSDAGINKNERVDPYRNAKKYWKQLYKMAAPYAETASYMMTTKEKGVTKQNLVLPSSLSTVLKTVGYGRKQLEREGISSELTPREAAAESTEFAETDLLKKRREKIDRMFANRAGMRDPKTGKYRSTLIQQLYDGDTAVGKQRVSAMYENKEYLNLSPEEVLCLQMVGYAHLDSEGTWFQMAQQKDAKQAMLISCDYRYDRSKKDDKDSLANHRLGSLKAMTSRVMREREQIQRHESMRRPYKMAWAVAHHGNGVFGYQINDGHHGTDARDYDEFYDVIEKRVVRVEGRQYRNNFMHAVGLLELYKEHNETTTKTGKKAVLKRIKEYKKKYPEAETVCDIHSPEEFESFAYHEFRSTYFTSETKYGELKELNRLRMDTDSVWIRLRAIEADFHELYKISKRDGKVVENDNYKKLNDEVIPVMSTVMNVLRNIEGTDRGEMSMDQWISLVQQTVDANPDLIEAGVDPDTAVEMMCEIFVAEAMESRLKSKLKQARVPRREYAEMSNLHRIEKALRGQPDYDGIMWEVDVKTDENNETVLDDDGDPVVVLYRPDTDFEMEVPKAEAKHYLNRWKAWERSQAKQRADALDPSSSTYVEDYASIQEEFFRGHDGKDKIQGKDKDKTYTYDFILSFEPRLKGHQALKKIIREQTSKNGETRKVSGNDVMDYVRRMWYDTFAGNAELIEMLGMSKNMFKSEEEITKRLHLFVSNGLRTFQQPFAPSCEYMITLSDDSTSISDDFTNQLETFANSDMSVKEAMDKLDGWMNIEATNAQGWITAHGYDEKTGQAGAAYSDPGKKKTLNDIKEGKRAKPGTRATVGTIKQKGAAPMFDRDPRGNIEAMPVQVKNSEAMVTDSSSAVDNPKSAQKQAFSEYCENKTFEVPKRDPEGNVIYDENGNPVMETVRISTGQRPSGMKTERKGIVVNHYVPSRVEALKELVSSDMKGEEARQQAIKDFIDKYNHQVDNTIMRRDTGEMGLDVDMVEAFKTEMREAASRLGIGWTKLTFEDIDEHIHNRIKTEAEQYIRSVHRGDAADAENRLNSIQQLMNMRSFMLPVKATPETVDELVDEIRKKVEKPDGSMNDQYVMAMPRKYQHMQIRPSDHLVDSTAHLPSQAVYITPTAIESERTYEIHVNGKYDENGDAVLIKESGADLYDKFNRAIAQHLLLGLKKAGVIFGTNKEGEEGLRELQKYLMNAVASSHKNVPEMMKALTIVNDVLDGGRATFITPLESIAVMYQLSEIFTSIVRNNTHRRAVTGANAVIQADAMLDNKLGVLRDKNKRVIGVECALPAWAKPLYELCLVNDVVEVMENGEPTVKEIQRLDINKLKGTGLDLMLGIRIPAEDCHSIVPLVVKEFLPAESGSSIMVAKEIITLTGGDNDFDKLILMIKNINKASAERGKLEAVEYDWDGPIEEMSEEQLQNMLIDIIMGVITDKSNEARWLTPQNPDTMHKTATLIAYSESERRLPMKLMNVKEGRTDRWVPITENDVPDFWTNPSYKDANFEWATDNDVVDDAVDKIDDVLAEVDDNSVNDIFDIAKNKDMHAVAKIGVAVAADSNATYAKIMKAAEVIEPVKFKTDDWDRLEGGIVFVNEDGESVNMDVYCPKEDVNGKSVYQNLADYAGMLVDAGSSPDVHRIGINLDNVFTVEFMLRCGFSKEMAALTANILKNEPLFIYKFRSVYGKLTKIDKENPENNGAFASYDRFEPFTMEDIKACQVRAAQGRLFDAEYLKEHEGQVSFLHALNYLMAVQENIRPWEHELKVESASHALSNEPAYAVYEQLLVDQVEKKVAKGEFMLDIKQGMILHNGLTAGQVHRGVFTTGNGVELSSGVARAQAFYTTGIESFNMLMRDQIFYAHPAFRALVNSMAPMLLSMSPKKATKLIKQLHDDFVTYVLSGMDMVQEIELGSDVQISGFDKMRDYYRNKFPNKLAPELRKYVDADKNHAILGVLYVNENGQLRVNDEKLKDYSLEDIRGSLVYLAQGTPKEKELAKEIFLCDFFTGGLRFEYGSISKLFTPSFLANPVFAEYNRTVADLCRDKMIGGKQLKRFVQQFIRANYNNPDYQFGPLITAASGIVKGADGKWKTMKEIGATAENLDLKEDQVMYTDVAALENWLARKSNPTHTASLDPGTYDEKKGPVPYRLLNIINRWVKDETLTNGSVFRLQTSFNPNEQNLYMLTKDEDGDLCIKKINDALATKFYDINSDFEEMAALDCAVRGKGKIGVWSVGGSGTMHTREEDRVAFLNGELSSFYKRINEDKDKADERKKKNAQDRMVFDEASGVSTIMDGVDDIVGIDGIGDPGDTITGIGGDEIVSDVDIAMDEQAGVSNDAVLFAGEYKTTKVPKLEMAGSVQYKGNNRFDISMYGEEVESAGKFTQQLDEDEFYDTDDYDDEETEFANFFKDHPLQAMIQMNATGSADAIENRKREVLDDHGVEAEYSSMRDAVNMAKEINADQDEFIAVVETEDGAHRVVLYDSADDNAVEQWKNQYGISVIADPISGISQVMDKTGTEVSDHFIDESTAWDFTSDNYQSEIDDLVTMIRTAFRNGNPVQVSEKTARDIVRKMRKVTKVNGFFANVKRVIRGAIEGNSADIEALNTLLGYDAISEVDGINEMTDEELEDVVEDIAEEAAVQSIAFPTATVDDLRAIGDTLADKVKNLQSGVYEELKKRLATSDIARLEQLQSDTVPFSGRISQQRQNSARDAAHDVDAASLRFETLRSVLERALQMEQQKRKMMLKDNDDVSDSSDRISQLNNILGTEDGLGLQGVLDYLGLIAKEYRYCAAVMASLNNHTHEDNLNNIAAVKRILASHEDILSELVSVLRSNALGNVVNEVSRVTTIDDDRTMKQLVDEIVRMHDTVRAQYQEQGLHEFVEYVKEFVGESDTVRLSDGRTVTWEQAFTEFNGDISRLDKWVRPVSRMSDPSGQLFARVISIAKAAVRKSTINDIQSKIKELDRFAVEKGITDFEFAFEHDASGKKTGYILTSVNNKEFYDELKKQQDEWIAVNENPRSTQQEREEALNKYKAWLSVHAAEDSTENYTPDQSMYASAEYERLRREEPDKFEFLKRFTELKTEFDRRLGRQTNHARAIQRRMTTEQRLSRYMTMSPSKIFDNLKSQLSNEYLIKEDDYMEAGQTSAILNFDGSERLEMPAPYTRMLKDPEELSTDIIGCLMAYSYATNNYTGMRNVMNPLEVGFDALVHSRVQNKRRAGREVVESFRIGKDKKAVVNGSRYLQTIRSFLDSQLYMKHIQDEDDTFSLFGKVFRKSKVANAFLRMSAKAQLGFNWLVDMASLANGILQTNIEAFSRRYFSGTALRKADLIYGKELSEFIQDLGNPIKRSRLSLIGQALDIMQNFDAKVYDNRRHNLLAKLTNANIAFMGTAGGNHWLYFRAAIAYMISKEVMVPGQDGEMVKSNLWEAFEIIDVEGGGRMARVKPGTKTMDGELITESMLATIGDQIKEINHDLFGIYNKEDMAMAQKVWYGKLLIAYRKHIVPLMDKRFRKKHRVAAFAGTDLEWQEGYWRTFGRLLLGIRDAQYKIPAAWNNLSPTEQANVRMAMFDLVQWLAMAALFKLITCIGGGDDDDDDETKAEEICKFLLSREIHEMGSMLPTLYMPKEALNIAQMPFMGTNQMADIYNFAHTVLAEDWDAKVKGGPFAGQTQLEMRTRKLPIPILSYYRNIDKSLNGMDNSTWFYSRGYVEHGGAKGMA